MAVKVGALLLQEGMVTPRQLQEALIHQRQNGGSLGAALADLGYVKHEDVAALVSRHYRVPLIDLSLSEVDPSIIKLIPAETARKYQILPLARAGATLTIAMADPTNEVAIADIKFMTGCGVERVVASVSSLNDAIERYYRSSGSQLKDTGGAGPARLGAAPRLPEVGDAVHPTSRPKRVGGQPVTGTTRPMRVFLSYCHKDLAAARRLHERLSAYPGVDVWFDKERLRAGQRWEYHIREAIRKSRFVVLLLSQQALRGPGFFYREMRMALDILEELPEDEVYILPARLDDCTPAIERLKALHQTDLFPDWDGGVDRLIEAVQEHAPNATSLVGVPRRPD